MLWFIVWYTYLQKFNLREDIMSDEMRGEVPFSNADLLKRAAKTREEFYKTHSKALEEIASQPVPLGVSTTTSKQPIKRGRPVYGGTCADLYKKIRI